MSLNISDIINVASRSDLSTYDPYDIWKTSLGFRCKNLFNHNPAIGIFPAALLELFDLFLNNRLRLFYKKQEYPIVRAFAALCLMNAHQLLRDPALLDRARTHLDWLVDNARQYRTGRGWGLGFRYAVQRNLIYTADTPFSTMTPYVLEALVTYSRQTGSEDFIETIRSIHDFFAKDLKVLEEGPDWIATSYTDTPDRVVTNAASYAMFALSQSLPYVEEARQLDAVSHIQKLYRFVQLNQRKDGSWLYSPRDRSFIDCFHSCIVIKNILKTRNAVDLHGSSELIEKGYTFIKESFLDRKSGLYRRFTVRNKPNPIALDLYDNAEMLSLALDMKDHAEAERLSEATARTFVRGNSIWSKISVLGTRHDCWTLRWAVFPYLFALTKLMIARSASASRSDIYSDKHVDHGS